MLFRFVVPYTVLHSKVVSFKQIFSAPHFRVGCFYFLMSFSNQPLFHGMDLAGWFLQKRCELLPLFDGLLSEEAT